MEWKAFLSRFRVFEVNINQIIYIAGEDNFKLFLLKFLLPMVLIITVGLTVFSYVLTFFELITFRTSIALSLLSPILEAVFIDGYI